MKVGQLFKILLAKCLPSPSPDAQASASQYKACPACASTAGTGEPDEGPGELGSQAV